MARLAAALAAIGFAPERRPGVVIAQRQPRELTFGTPLPTLQVQTAQCGE